MGAKFGDDLYLTTSMAIASQVAATWYIRASQNVRRLESEAMPDHNDP